MTMRMLQSILFATDFDPASVEAIRVGSYLAKAFNSRISVLHVLKPSSQSVARYLRLEFVDIMLQRVRKQFSDSEVMNAECSITVGPIADSILKKAIEIDADLIVLGSGKISITNAFPLGPVPHSVMEQATQPVLVVRGNSLQTQFQTILCPIDHSSVSRRGLRNAIRLAKVLGSKLIVLSVVPDVNWLTAAVATGEFGDVKSEFQTQWSQELDSFLANIDFEGVHYSKQLRLGIAHDEISMVAREEKADIIIMGATGRTGLVRVLLGSTTRQVLRELPCSLLVVKQEDIVEELFESDLRIISLLMAEGIALKGAGAFELGATKFRQVLARNPFHLAATESLAESLQKLGYADEAESYVRRANQLKGNDLGRTS